MGMKHATVNAIFYVFISIFYVNVRICYLLIRVHLFPRASGDLVDPRHDAVIWDCHGRWYEHRTGEGMEWLVNACWIEFFLAHVSCIVYFVKYIYLYFNAFVLIFNSRIISCRHLIKTRWTQIRPRIKYAACRIIVRGKNNLCASCSSTILVYISWDIVFVRNNVFSEIDVLINYFLRFVQHYLTSNRVN